MLNRVVHHAVQHRLVVLMLVFIGLTAALQQLPSLMLDAFPDVTNVQVSINTEAPGLAAEEVEQLVTAPIESALYALPYVTELRSVSRTGLSGITVVFAEGTPLDQARQWVFERVQGVQHTIPNGVGIPELGPNTTGLGQIFQYVLSASPESGIDVMALRSLNDWLVKRLLMPVDGVTDVLSFGGQVRQYQILLNPLAMQQHGIRLETVANAVQNNHRHVAGGYQHRGQEQAVIRGLGWLPTGEEGLQALRQIPITTSTSSRLTIADIADVQWGAEVRQGATTYSERTAQGNMEQRGEVVSGIVLKHTDANSKATIDALRARIPDIQRALPDGVNFQVVYDQTQLIEAAVRTVGSALLLAFLLISIVLTLCMASVRGTLLVLLSVPLSVLFALAIMAWLGISANLMSLGGLALAIGLLVDGSVVMVDAIVQRKSEQSLQQAAGQVARPIFFASTIILLVFVPLFSFEGVEAKLFEPMALAIMLALLVALVVALVVVPACASVFWREQQHPPSPSRWQQVAQRHYQQQLLRLQQRPAPLLVATIGLLLITLWLAPKLGTEFVPELEEGTLNLRVTLAPAANLDTALTLAPQLEQVLLSFPEVTYTLSRIGRPELGGDPEPINNIEIYVGLLPRSEWQSARTRHELQAQMSHQLEQFPGLLFNFSQPIATRVDELLSGVRATLAIKLFGPDLEQLTELGKQLEQLVQSTAGTRDVALEQLRGEGQLSIHPNRDALYQRGLSVADISRLVGDGLHGQAIGEITEQAQRYAIWLQIHSRYRTDIDAIAELPLLNTEYPTLMLRDVADVRYEQGIAQIRRDHAQRRIVVEANVVGRDLGSVVSDIQQRIATELPLPSGYYIDIGGQFENQQRAQARLMTIVPLTLILIALLLFLAFRSIGQTLLIMVNVPLALMGGVLALWISGLHLSVASAIGFITLLGVALLNGVVMVDSINRQREHHDDLRLAIIHGAGQRLLPVFMTATTSMLGLLPILFATGLGSEIQIPMATVIVGGLITSTILTLGLLPLLYPYFASRHSPPSHAT